ncbi:ISAs1 family transposase [Stenoxybacter acetivorans]|uniref:ISAs1 family transposase n=1 Tax=Stenoxybacter acetivorans TaxID=422441 RepID=UPI000691639F|nr:ISAs1 family transposase [Stenoxybacter acetivorans]
MGKETVSGLTDPRRPYGNLRHKLEDIVIIGLLSVICMGEDFVDMEMFGREREETLRTALALELPNGIPDSDTFRRVFECLDPQGLFDGLNKMLEFGLIRSNVINIDGKTIRGSGNAFHSPYHTVSAWVSEHQITLGQLVKNLCSITFK